MRLLMVWGAIHYLGFTWVRVVLGTEYTCIYKLKKQ